MWAQYLFFEVQYNNNNNITPPNIIIIYTNRTKVFEQQ